jgi:hypothetical protein
MSSGEWFMDSGANRHITNDRECMFDYEPLSKPRPVLYGNGLELPGIGTGKVKLVTRVAGRDTIVVLKNVLYVPKGAFNLLSVKQMVASGAAVEFTDEGCLLKYKGKSIARAVEHKGLYRLLTALEDDAPAAMVSNVKSDAELWHRRFGHLSYGNLAKVQRHDMVTGMDVSEKEFQARTGETCEPCVMGKQHRLPFPESSPSSTEQLDLLHMDVGGPMPEPSLGGSRYYVTLLDDATDFAAALPVHSKADVPAVVMQVINMFENQSGKRVKAVRTDRGGEFVNGQLQEFYAKKGIIHQKSAPYTPQQNGKAERLNRTLMDRVRC